MMKPTRYDEYLDGEVFSFTFEKWYALNKWDERYECYSIIDSSHSQVSLTKMTLLVGESL